MLQPPCSQATSRSPTPPQVFASHAPEADGRLRGSGLLRLVASLAEGQVGGGLGLVPCEELERVLLLPSAGPEPEREGKVSLEGWVGDGEGGDGEGGDGEGGEGAASAETRAGELGGAAGAAARGILEAAAMREGVSFLEAAARIARLLRRQGPDGKRLSWARYRALLRHVSSQAGHSLPAHASEEEVQESAALCRTFDSLERGALGPLQFRKLMALLDEQNGWMHSAIQARPRPAA